MNSNLEITKAKQVINKLDYPLVEYPLIFSLLNIPTNDPFTDFDLLQKHLNEFQFLLSAEASLVDFVHVQSRLIKQTLLSLLGSSLVYDPFILEDFSTLSNIDKAKTTAFYNSSLNLFENARSGPDVVLDHVAFREDGSSYETIRLPYEKGLVYEIKTRVGDKFKFLIRLDVASIKDATFYYELLDNYKNKVEVYTVDSNRSSSPAFLGAGIPLDNLVSIDFAFTLEKPSEISKGVSYFVCGLKNYFILNDEFESTVVYTSPRSIDSDYTVFSLELDAGEIESYYSLFSDQTNDWTPWSSFKHKDRVYSNERKTISNSSNLREQVTSPIRDVYTNKNLVKILYDIDDVDFVGLYSKNSNSYYADVEECLLLMGVGYLAAGTPDSEFLGWTVTDNGYVTYFKPHYDFTQKFHKLIYINNEPVNNHFEFKKDTIYKINILESNWKPVYSSSSSLLNIDPAYPNNQKYIFQGRSDDKTTYPQRGIIFNNLGRYVPYDILELNSDSPVFSLTVNERDKVNFCIPKKENYSLYGKERCIFWLPIYKKNTNPSQIKFKFVLDSRNSFIKSYTVKVK